MQMKNLFHTAETPSRLRKVVASVVAISGNAL